MAVTKQMNKIFAYIIRVYTIIFILVYEITTGAGNEIVRETHINLLCTRADVFSCLDNKPITEVNMVSFIKVSIYLKTNDKI